MNNKILPAALLLLAATGCVNDRRPAQGPSDVEYSDQEEYANTQPVGTGESQPTGYYGVGNAEEPTHRPASPKANGGHQPY